MSELSDLIWEASKDNIKKALEIHCLEYENNYHDVHKINENNKLVGVYILTELEGIIYIEECHYTGNNHFTACKYWKKIFNKNKCYRARTFKTNKRVFDFLLKMGFKIINEDKFCFYLEFRRG